MVGIIDTHAHLYAEQLQPVDDVINRLKKNGVVKVFLPNIDLESIAPMKDLALAYPDLCFPMMGLHPCSVQEDYKTVLNEIYNELEQNKFCAVGEIGIDLYWDKSTKEIQIDAFKTQCHWAMKYNLPVAIHSRESTDIILDILEHDDFKNLTGVFHCFTGDEVQAKRIVDLDFYLGIGGVLTYKNSSLREVLKCVSLDKILLETDSPYLPPVPFRGKINEPSFLIHVVHDLAKVYECEEFKIVETTYNNALNLFKI